MTGQPGHAAQRRGDRAGPGCRPVFLSPDGGHPSGSGKAHGSDTCVQSMWQMVRLFRRGNQQTEEQNEGSRQTNSGRAVWTVGPFLHAALLTSLAVLSRDTVNTGQPSHLPPRG